MRAPLPSIALLLLVPSNAFPSFRFLPWNYIDDFVRKEAVRVGYNASTWDAPGTFELESQSFEVIEQTMPEKAEALELMGFRDHRSWNCWMVHYEDWLWSEIVAYNLSQPFLDLGYTGEAWNDDIKPDAFRRYWDDLTDDEQAVAEELCYTRGSWDGLPLDQWTMAVDNDRLDIPYIRYTPWGSLPFNTRIAASKLGYNETTWNNLYSNEIEFKSYSSLVEQSPNLTKAIRDMGLDGPTYDCYINHYSDFHFEELNKLGLDDYFRTLGWDEKSWYGEEPVPQSERTLWVGLNEIQKTAARKLCFNQVSWDGKSLDDLTFSPDGPCGIAAETCHDEPDKLRFCASRPKTNAFGMVKVERCYSEARVEYLLERYPDSYCGACVVENQDPTIPTCEEHLCGIDEYRMCAVKDTRDGSSRESEICVSPIVRNRVFRKYPGSYCGRCDDR